MTTEGQELKQDGGWSIQPTDGLLEDCKEPETCVTQRCGSCDVDLRLPVNANKDVYWHGMALDG